MDTSVWTLISTGGAAFWLTVLAVAVFTYFCGCFNGAVIVSKYLLRNDVRNHGSGNAGLTNFFRVFGGPLTLVVILTDVLKAVVAMLVSEALFGIFVGKGIGALLLAQYWASLFCLLGHMFPCMFHFKGGKGILSGGTLAIMIDWRIALVVWGGFLLLSVLTRYVSLGSLWAGVSFPFATWACSPDPVIVVLGFLIGGLVVWQHRGNAKRILKGTENKFSLHHKKEGTA